MRSGVGLKELMHGYFWVVLIIFSVFQTEAYSWDDGKRDVLGDTWRPASCRLLYLSCGAWGHISGTIISTHGWGLRQWKKAGDFMGNWVRGHWGKGRVYMGIIYISRISSRRCILRHFVTGLHILRHYVTEHYVTTSLWTKRHYATEHYVALWLCHYVSTNY